MIDYEEFRQSYTLATVPLSLFPIQGLGVGDSGVWGDGPGIDQLFFQPLVPGVEGMCRRRRVEGLEARAGEELKAWSTTRNSGSPTRSQRFPSLSHVSPPESGTKACFHFLKTVVSLVLADSP